MKGFKSTLTDPYTYTQSGAWKKGQYTFQAVVLSDSGYAFAFQRADTTWQKVDLSWQVRGGSYSKVQWTFTLEVNAVAFRLIANTVRGETVVVQPMLENGSNGSTPIAHEEDLRGMDGDFHEFIFTRNDTGIAPEPPLSTQEDDLEPEGWTDNPKGVTKEIPFEFVSMREKHSGVWLDFSPPSLWAKWAEDGLSVNIRVQGHYQSHWEGVNKITEIVGGEIINGTEVVKCTAIFRKGEEDIAPDVASSRGFIWEVNGVEIARDVPYITLDESYGDGLADYVTLSYLIGNKRESDQAEILNISEGMDGIGEEFIFKANNSDTVPPVLPKTTDAGYQNDDYHGNWSDDPVAPTESNQFVWAAKRKKVGGIWEAFGDPSVWTKWVKDGDDSKSLILSASSLTMACYSTNAAKPGQTISFEAKLQNVSGTATFVATPYNDDGTALTAITLGGSGNTRTLTNAQWLTTYKKIEVVATLGSLSDTVTITRLPDGDDGEDGITISPNQQGYTYRADLNEDIIGSIANGMVELTITSGSTPITCPSATSGGTPTANGTYRVTRTLGNGITTNSSVSGGKYRITPATLTDDEAFVKLEIKIMMGGVVTSYPLTLTYRKQFDGADGKSTEFIFKGHTSDTTSPTLPSTSQQDDWYGQGTSYEWNDDLVEPTKALPYVWASQRKKVDGVWGAFTPAKVWLRYSEDAKSLILSASSLTMACSSTNVAKTGQTITIKAKLQNVTGNASFDATPYNASGTALTKITLGGSGNTRTLTDAQWLSTFQKVVITATLSGLSDSLTITRLPDGGDGEPAKSIHLKPSAKAISITKGNIPVPASVSVIGTAVNTTIQYWYYSVNDATSFTSTRPTGVAINNNTVTINSATARFKTLSIKAKNSTDNVEDLVTITRSGGAPYVDETTRTWWTWDEELGVYTDTGMSPVGSDGVIPYPAGYYDSTKRYRREQDYTPYVQYGEVLYLLIRDTPYAGILPTEITYWKAFNQWEAVFISSLVAQFAKIGGAVFTGDTSNVSSNVRGRLISQKGVNNTNNYNTYTGDSGSWQPKLMLDFETGKAVFDEAKIRGEVEATSGKIAGFTISGTGLSNSPLFNNDAYVVFRNDANKTFAGIGGNVLPSISGATGVARFENRATNSFYGSTNYAMIVEASGATRNIAINAVGDVIVKGAIIEAESTFGSVGYTNDITLRIGQFRRFLFYPPSGSNIGINVPTATQLTNALGSSSMPSSWSIDLDIAVAYNAAGTIVVLGQVGGVIVDNDGSNASHNSSHTQGGVEMKKGDVLTLRFYSYSSRWLIINHQY